MKILLVNPMYDIEKYYGKLYKMGFKFPPVGLTYLAGYIREKGHDVLIYDFQVNKSNFRNFFNKYQPELVGITCQTAIFYSTLRLANEIKKENRNTIVVAGGAHASYRPNDFFEESSDIDVVVRGEGEITFLEIINYYQHHNISLEDIKGISFKQNDEIINNPPRELIENLGSLPLPAIDLLPLDKYKVSPDNYLGGRVGLIATSRGCPYNCIFCSCKQAFNRKYRARGLDKVFDEIKFYIEYYNISQLFIMDDCFTLNRRRTEEFCERMITTGYNKKVRWWCQSRADLTDKNLLKKMKEAGCMIISFGIESGVQRILDSISKNITKNEIKQAVKLAKKVGLQPRGSFIIGLPGESFLDSISTIYFALSLPLSQAKFGIATPFPGSQLWDIALSEGQVKDRNENWDRFTVWSSYSKYEPVYIAKGRKKWELKLLQKVANTIFYIQPSVFLSYIKRIENYNDFKYIAKAGLKFIYATFSKKPAN